MFPLTRPARIAVLASGRGTNLDALLREFDAEDPLGQVVLVVSDKAEAPALARARSRGVEARHVAWPNRTTFEAEVGSLCRDRRIDLICLAGFMRLLSAQFVREFEGRILNIHPSLLPEFPGLHAHRQALAAGVAESGCSVHLVDEGVDTGPILLRRRVPVLPGDSEESLAARILAEEHHAYPEAVRIVLSGRVSRDGTEEGE